MSDKRVGKRFKEYRKEMGLKQRELAARLGVTDNYISAIERGLSFPEYKILVALLNELKASPNVILGDVLDHEVDGAVPPLMKKLEGLPEKKREYITQTFEFMVDLAKEETEQNKKPQQIDNPPKT